MRTRVKFKAALLFLVLWAIFESNLSFAAGISTRFGDVTVENLAIGNRYSMRETARLPLVIQNNSDSTIEVRIDVLPPAESELKPGYEPIPDISWIELEKRELVIGPRMHGETDVFINIPDDKKFENKKYQVYIWSHSVGGTIGLGLKSRLRFSIISEETAAKKKVERKARGTFEFEIEPTEIILEDIQPGTIFDVQKETGAALRIKNNAAASKEFRVESIRVSDSLAELPPNFRECPNPSFLLFESGKEFIVPAGTEKEIRLLLVFPDREEYRGKKYLFIIHVQQEGVGIYSKLYVSTAK